MKKKMKWVLAMLACVLIVGVSSGAVASRGERNVTIHYSDIKLYVDGEYVQPRDANGTAVEPFIMNGTTYLPVRAVGNALGMDVEWDGATSTVYLGEKPSSVSGEVWTVRNYVDVFQQPTDEQFITNIKWFEGTFSNSATTNSRLTVQMAVDAYEGQQPRVTIFLNEYGNQLVKNSDSVGDNIYAITMRDANGNDTYMTGTMYCKGGDRIYIDQPYVNTVLEALRGSGTVSFRLVFDEYSVSSYLFSVETGNFRALYDSIAN